MEPEEDAVPEEWLKECEAWQKKKHKILSQQALPMDFGQLSQPPDYIIEQLKGLGMLHPNFKFKKAPTFQRSQTMSEQLPSGFKQNGWWW